MDTVYMPGEDSFMMKGVLEDYLRTQDPRPKTVLDLGTGSGILAIAAAKQGCSVTAADINPEAILLAKENAGKENVKIKFILSDLFENIKAKYDLIVFNPPYVPTEDSEPKTMESIAWDGGPDGLSRVRGFLSSVSSHLNPGGKILLLVSSSTEDPPAFQGFNQKILAKKSYFFERLFVLELSPLI
jgi:release factor glutamine methyltransferase